MHLPTCFSTPPCSVPELVLLKKRCSSGPNAAPGCAAAREGKLPCLALYLVSCIGLRRSRPAPEWVGEGRGGEEWGGKMVQGAAGCEGKERECALPCEGGQHPPHVGEAEGGQIR
jgi:hypothetical protein